MSSVQEGSGLTAASALLQKAPCHVHKPRALSCSSEGYELVTHIHDSQWRATVHTHRPGREALAGFAPLLMGSESHSGVLALEQP